jgi:hypothetical protein
LFCQDFSINGEKEKMSEQEKAEQLKKELLYDPVPYGEYDENGQLPMVDEEPCEYGFSEDCVEPSLRNTNCCFECWLYTEVDEETKKQAKEIGRAHV